jgi:hypothetical protein
VNHPAFHPKCPVRLAIVRASWEKTRSTRPTLPDQHADSAMITDA